MSDTTTALATLAATSAFAQVPVAQSGGNSSVTVFGGLDARVNSMTATNAGTLTRLDNSGEYSSRLGFRGTEDLGGGWSAAFWLEAGLNNDDGRGQNSTANNTNMGQNFSVGTGNANSAAAYSTTNTGGITGAQYSTPTTSGLGGLQGITFNRASTVSLINKDLGEIRAGRDYAPTFWNNTVYDPFGTVGVGSANNVILGTLNPTGASIAPPGTAKPQVRTSNSVGWLSPAWNGFRAQAQYAYSEVPSNCLGLDTVAVGQSLSNSCAAAAKDGKYTGFRLSYANGPLSLAAATGTAKYATSVDTTAAAIAATGIGINGASSTGNVPFLGDYKATNFGGTYDLGVAKLWGQYGTQTQGAVTSSPYSALGSITTAAAAVEAKLTHYLLGVTVPMGQWTHKFSLNNGKRTATGVADRTQDQYALGTVYAMSKRTSLYATYSSMTAKGDKATASMALTSSAATATADVKATGWDIGISHRF